MCKVLSAFNFFVMPPELLKTYLRFLFAFILSALSAMLGNILDGVIAGQMIGPEAVAAIGTSRPMTQGFYTLHLLIGAGGGMLVGLAIGKERRDEANGIFRTVVSVMFTVAAIATVLGIFVPKNIAQVFCTEAALLPLAEPYISWMLIGAFAYFGMYIMQTYVAVDGEPGLVPVAVIIDNAVNVILSVILIKYFNMGLAGAAIGTVVGHALAALLLFILHWCQRKNSPRLRFATGQPFRFSSVGRIAAQGAPLAIASMCLTALLYSANIIIMDTLGKDGMFIYAVALNLLLVYNLFLAGSCQTLQSLGAIERGKGGPGFGQVVRFTYLLLAASSTLVCVFAWICPGLIASLFGGGERPELLAATNSALRVFAPSFILFCLIYVHMIVSKLKKKSGVALFISFALSLTVIPVLWAFAHFAPAYIWWSYLVAYLIEIAAIGGIEFLGLKRTRSNES